MEAHQLRLQSKILEREFLVCVATGYQRREKPGVTEGNKSGNDKGGLRKRAQRRPGHHLASPATPS